MNSSNLKMKVQHIEGKGYQCFNFFFPLKMGTEKKNILGCKLQSHWRKCSTIASISEYDQDFWSGPTTRSSDLTPTKLHPTWKAWADMAYFSFFFPPKYLS